jgi:DHA1 family bicyclomycin/chloramphenicol resistance-like MFS transporter
LASRAGSLRWIVTLVALTAVGALAIDTSLPAQPAFARTFGANAQAAQLTLSVFLIGYGLAQLVVGYLSDALGRRRVLLAGLALFATSGLACATSSSIEVLIAARLVQGIGAAAPPVIARAMVRDSLHGKRGARLFSTILAIGSVAPMIAPTIGSGLLAAFGWRSIFAMLAICGTILFAVTLVTLRETHPPSLRSEASLSGLVLNYRRFFTTRGTGLPLAVACTAFAGQFAYISASPFIYQDGFHVSAWAYAVYFAATALAVTVGSLTGRALLRRGRKPTFLIARGPMLLVAGGIAVAIGAHVGELGIAGFLIPMVVYFFGAGLTTPSAVALSMELVPQIAGTASAAIGSLMIAAGAFAGYGTTQLGGTSPGFFSCVVLVMALVAATLAWKTVAAARRREREKEIAECNAAMLDSTLTTMF